MQTEYTAYGLLVSEAWCLHLLPTDTTVVTSKRHSNSGDGIGGEANTAQRFLRFGVSIVSLTRPAILTQYLWTGRSREPLQPLSWLFLSK